MFKILTKDEADKIVFVTNKGTDKQPDFYALRPIPLKDGTFYICEDELNDPVYQKELLNIRIKDGFNPKTKPNTEQLDKANIIEYVPTNNGSTKTSASKI